MRLRNGSLAGLAAGFALLLAAVPSHAQITNGSLTGPISNGGVPPGWSVLLGSPDTMDENNNVGVPGLLDFGATPSPSPNGGTWVGIGADGASGFFERFGQTMTGLTVGQSYRVSWFGSNFGFSPNTFGYVNPNSIEMFIGGSSVGTGGTIALGPGWVAQSLNFTAASTSQSIAFQLGTGNKSYMGIDGIAIQAQATVPEPGSLALIATGLTGLGLAMRRRRAAS